MVKKLNITFLIATFLLITSTLNIAIAQGKVAKTIKDKNLRFDLPLNPNIGDLYFDQDDILKPEENDFELVHAAPMSNEYGHRWALVTIRNTSSGQRLLKNNNIVATFANGKQSYGSNLDEAIKGHNSLSKAIYFGKSSFPIIKVEVGK